MHTPLMQVALQPRLDPALVRPRPVRFTTASTGGRVWLRAQADDGTLQDPPLYCVSPCDLLLRPATYRITVDDAWRQVWQDTVLIGTRTRKVAITPRTIAGDIFGGTAMAAGTVAAAVGFLFGFLSLMPCDADEPNERCERDSRPIAIASVLLVSGIVLAATGGTTIALNGGKYQTTEF